MTAPSIEERLRRARGMAAVIARTANQSRAHNDGSAPPPAFWAGLSDLADAIEDDVAAVSKALDAHTMEEPAPATFVEK